jgi:23S rRNA (uracil1939-C5)-methyltransferase
LKELEVRTTSMTPSGEAIAHYEEGGERRAILVRGGVPNETVRVTVDASKRPARGDILSVIEPGEGRVTPPCKYVIACGGCDWMHLSRALQREAHLALAPASVAAVFHEAPHALGYRTRTRLHLEEHRGRLRVGFFGARSREIVCVETCIVLDPRLDKARDELSALFAGAHGDGEASLALGRALPVAEIKWSRDLPAEVFGRLDKAKTSWQGFRVWCGESRRPAVLGDPTPWITGPDGPMELSPGGFSQPHAEVNTALALRVAELAGDAKRTVELYAGAGNLTVLLARGRDVRAVESDEEACAAARRNLRARDLQARVTCADAATFDIPGGTDLVVLDPPRTGAREACERLVARPVARVVYVSCDRATLARDLGLLESRYAVSSVDVFEMFPHTSHAETVVLLERRRPTRQ